MAVTQVQANRILNFNFGSRTQSPVGTLYLGLSTTAPDALGANITEPAFGALDYQRIVIDNTDDEVTGKTWTSASAGKLSNAKVLSFPYESLTSWGTITHLFIADHQTNTGSNVLYYSQLLAPRTVPDHTTVYFDVNSLSISMV